MICTLAALRMPSFLMMADRHGDGSEERQEGTSPSADGVIRHVAVVEDELMVAWSLGSMLEDLGYDVAGIFSTGEDAIAALADVAVDLICMDINLGRGIDGIETARRIRERQPTAILFISAYSDDLTHARIREIAPDALRVGKPTSMAALQQAISNFTRSAS